MLRFRDRPDEGWSEPVPVSVNAPVEHDGFWYFQAQWDPPDEPRFQGDVASAGLNYTVLGVGVLFTLWSGFCQYRALAHGTAVTAGKYDDKLRWAKNPDQDLETEGEDYF